MSAHAFLRALDTLPSWRAVVWVASTTGQGEAPPTLRALWRALLRRSLPHNLLAGQAAAVFGLGDSGYTHYNVVAKKLYRRLEGLGALMLGPAGLGDDRAAGGHEAALAPWLTDLWHRLRAQVPLTPGLTEAAPEDRYTRPTCKWAVEVCAASPSPPEGAPAQAAEAGGCRAAVQSAALAAHVAIAEMEDEAALASVPGAGEMWGVGQGAPPPHAHDSPARPLTARVAATRRMTAPDHWQDVRHLELEVPGAEYEPGDVLSVLPRQDPAAVVAFIERCGAGLAPGTTVEVRRLAPGPETAGPAPRHLRLGDLVAGALDVAAASPRRTFFEVLRDTARSGLERERLEYLCSAEGLEDLATYNQLEGRTVLEVLQDFPSARPDLGWLLTAVPRLAPRAFSIASSPLAHPGAAHLTLAVVGWVTPFKRRRRGLCSAWLAGLRPGDELPAWTQRGALRLPPDPATPLVLVGPGTGVAPMRAFLQHREAQRRHGVPGARGSCAFRLSSGAGRGAGALGVAPARPPHVLSSAVDGSGAWAGSREPWSSSQPPHPLEKQEWRPACSSSAAATWTRTACMPRSGAGCGPVTSCPSTPLRRPAIKTTRSTSRTASGRRPPPCGRPWTEVRRCMSRDPQTRCRQTSRQPWQTCWWSGGACLLKRPPGCCRGGRPRGDTRWKPGAEWTRTILLEYCCMLEKAHCMVYA
ncbi:NFR1 [Auxenochlorella protothecoides x Auxenochlorella symbiontica]